MAKHMLGSFFLAIHKSLTAKQCLKKKSGIKTKTALWSYFFRKKEIYASSL